MSAGASSLTMSAASKTSDCFEAEERRPTYHNVVPKPFGVGRLFCISVHHVLARRRFEREAPRNRARSHWRA